MIDETLDSQTGTACSAFRISKITKSLVLKRRDRNRQEPQNCKAMLHGQTWCCGTCSTTHVHYTSDRGSWKIYYKNNLRCPFKCLEMFGIAWASLGTQHSILVTVQGQVCLKRIATTKHLAEKHATQASARSGSHVLTLSQGYNMIQQA